VKSFRHAHERSAVTEQAQVVVTAADSLYRLVAPDYVEPDGQVNLFSFCYRKNRGLSLDNHWEGYPVHPAQPGSGL
jgi:hypothetical protein